jgi:galactokinase
LRITSDVPVGAGLSSSAALEIAILRGLRQAASLSLDDTELALIAHRGETAFVGAPVGIMDPMAASLADEHTALYLDTRTRHWERLALPGELTVVVIHSGITHDHVTGEYRTRRAEVEAATQALGMHELRDLGPEEAPAMLQALSRVLRRRAEHVVAENQRVRAAVAALRASALPQLGSLLDASHASLRDLFEVSLPEIDRLVELAHEEPSVWGARLTGGGFGGSVVVLAPTEGAHALAERIARRYADETGRTPTVVAPTAIPREGAPFQDELPS